MSKAFDGKAFVNKYMGYNRGDGYLNASRILAEYGCTDDYQWLRDNLPMAYALAKSQKTNREDIIFRDIDNKVYIHQSMLIYLLKQVSPEFSDYCNQQILELLKKQGLSLGQAMSIFG